ncbi:MAG: hypothetical protein M3R55_14305 [Acidobacteriota bacterium]|nr:hypothetical protein [Acidobacteriota bacterium]
MRRLVLLALLTLPAACATAQARVPVAPQPLDVPPVPARVIVPEIEETAPPAADPGPAKAAPQRADPPARQAERTETARPGTPERTEESPRPRTPPTANEEQAERDTRAVMGRASATLNALNQAALSPAARQQFETARRFITQADNALKIRNYVFARNLADKADTLARQLGK